MLSLGKRLGVAVLGLVTGRASTVADGHRPSEPSLPAGRQGPEHENHAGIFARVPKRELLSKPKAQEADRLLLSRRRWW